MNLDNMLRLMMKSILTRLKDFVKYKLNESISSERTLEYYFIENGITLAKQSELTYLSCSNNDIVSLKGIENCTNLTVIDCFNNNLTSLEGIESCTKLTVLYCFNNNLTSLEGIENLTKLTELSCSNNDIVSLKGIENLTNLTELSCHNNKLTSLEGIENYIKLTKLYCSGNKLTSLKGTEFTKFTKFTIENLINLTELHCVDNQLISLEGIENLTNLTVLYCGNNNLPFNNYDGMSVKEIKDSFYLVQHETEISSILFNIIDDYDIDRYGYEYEFNDNPILTEDLLKELKRVSKKLNILGITVDATIGDTIYPITDITDIHLNEYITQIHFGVVFNKTK